MSEELPTQKLSRLLQIKLSDYRKIPIRTVILGLAVTFGAITAVSFFSRSLFVVQSGYVGVIETAGMVSPKSLKPGVHWIHPFGNVELYSTRMRDIKEVIEATSSEGLSFSIDVSLQYHIDPNNVIEIHNVLGEEQDEIIISRLRSMVRMITAQHPAESIYSNKRQEVSDSLKTRLIDEIEPLGLVVDAVYLRKVVLPDSLQASIQKTLDVAQAEKQFAAQIEQAKQEAERKLIEAQGEAERRLIEAQGEADAQAILAKEVTPAVLQLRSIEAMEKLAGSSNAKVLIMGGSNDQVPLLNLGQ